jgi:hypothetical protein
MYLMVFRLITAILLGVDSPSPENPLFAELLEKGILISDDVRVKLPPPVITDGLDAEAQHAAIAGIAGLNHPLDELLRKSVVAPFELNIRAIETPGVALARTVDVYFVAYGDWDVLNSKTFREELEKGRERKNTDSQFAKFSLLNEAALAKHGISPRANPDQEEQYHFTTLVLFDKVEISAVVYSQTSRKAGSAILAARIDPRFCEDPEYPNRWRSLIQDLENPEQDTYGPPHSYQSFGFYSKATRLIKPEGAIFIEHHFVYQEPQGWFGGINLLRSKLPLVVQNEIRDFRRKLAKASGGKY